MNLTLPLPRLSLPRLSLARLPGRLATWARYCAVSAVSTATGLTTLGLLVGVVGMNATLANVVATGLGTVPSFELNRRWVWAHDGKRSLARQVLPFVALSFAGLLLSTLAVHVAAAHTTGWSRGWHTAAVEAANVAAYGVLWVVQFFLLDRVLFAGHRSPAGGAVVMAVAPAEAPTTGPPAVAPPALPVPPGWPVEAQSAEPQSPGTPPAVAAPDGDGGRQPRWVLPALLVLLGVTAAAYLWDLSASGYANSFYAAAVQAGTKSWKAFFFGSLDSSNFITVDKSPASLWVMELSGRLFGFNSWSLLVPQVLEGVAAVGLVYAAVKRWFGAPAGLLAGAVLACTPVAALMFRFDNPDALMVLLLVAAAYALVRGLEKAGTRWMVLVGALLGFAFLAKMLQAFTVLPAFAGVYLLAAPTRLRRRLWQLAVGGVAVVVAAGWWVATVALWPAADRPLIDGSPDNNIVNLIFGYNGLQRLSSSGPGGGGNFSGTTGVFRLFNDLMGGQASWLLPAALLALVAGVAWRGRAGRTDRTRAALLLWGGWLLVTGAVFSFGGGVIHTYYTVALAPAIAALVGIGGVLLWQHRDRLIARLVGAAAIVGTAVWAFALLDRTPTYVPWLRFVVLVVGLASAALLVAGPWLGHAGAGRRRLVAAALALGLLAGLAGPLATTVTTVSTAHTGSIPSAGPTTAGAVGAGVPGGGAGSGGAGGFPGGSGGFPGGASARGGAGPGAGGGLPGAGSTSGRTGRGGFPGAGGGLPGGDTGVGAGAPGGGAGGQTVSTALAKALETDAGHYRWVAATFGSQSAASLELATGGEPVMAIGGFNGEDGNISLATFKSYVAKGDIHYFVASGGTGAATGGPGGGAGGPGGQQNADSAITSWVAAHFTAKTVGGQTVYDLTAPK